MLAVGTLQANKEHKKVEFSELSHLQSFLNPGDSFLKSEENVLEILTLGDRHQS